MAAGFWRKLLSVTRKEEEAALEAEEEQRLKQEGHVRKHYICSGRVQEVGFRYTAFYIAEDLGLSGWVSNREDGRVEMELQGKPETIDMLLCRLDGSGRISITSIEEEEISLQHAGGFRVRGS